MRSLVFLLGVLGASSALAQECFVENLPKPIEAAQYDAQMRALMLAHVPIEFRNSCGLRDETDAAYYEAVRARVGCETSTPYQDFFGHFLEDQDTYLFAVNRTDLRTDEAFETYCEIVERIDLSHAVREDGSVNVGVLQANGPLFQALTTFIGENRWDN